MVIMDELAIVFCSPLRNDGGFVVVCCQMGIIFTNKHKWSRVPEWSDAFQIKKNNANMISWSYGAHEVVTIWAQPGDSPWSQPGAKLWACCLENQSACEWIPKTLVKYVLLVLLLLIKSVLGILETDHDCVLFRSLWRSVSEIGYVVLIPMFSGKSFGILFPIVSGHTIYTFPSFVAIGYPCLAQSSPGELLASQS